MFLVLIVRMLAPPLTKVYYKLNIANARGKFMFVNFIDWYSNSAVCKVRTHGLCLMKQNLLTAESEIIHLRGTTNN